MSSPSYSGSQTIQVTGSVSPAPGSGTSAVIDVWNPSGTLVHTDDVPVNGTTGAFSDSFAAGGTNWIDGAYTVEAAWAPSISGTTVIGTAAFSYATTTSSTTTTTLTTTTTVTVTGPTVNATYYQLVQNEPNAVFLANARLIVNGTVSYNFLGTGGNDTFNLFGGNASAIFLATGVLNNTFNIVTGNPGTNGIMGVNSTTFSLISGANSTFNILQNNYNSSVTFSIIAGPNSVINDTSTGPVYNTLMSINLGTNSTVSLGAQFIGNETTINVVY
jgi:hypothetical protein